MKTLSSLGQRDGARMARIKEVLERSREWVHCSVLAEAGRVSRRRVAFFVRMLRADGFRVEYRQRYSYDRRFFRGRMEGHYRMIS